MAARGARPAAPRAALHPRPRAGGRPSPGPCLVLRAGRCPAPGGRGPLAAGGRARGWPGRPQRPAGGLPPWPGAPRARGAPGLTSLPSAAGQGQARRAPALAASGVRRPPVPGPRARARPSPPRRADETLSAKGRRCRPALGELRAPGRARLPGGRVPGVRASPRTHWALWRGPQAPRRWVASCLAPRGMGAPSFQSVCQLRGLRVLRAVFCWGAERTGLGSWGGRWAASRRSLGPRGFLRASSMGKFLSNFAIRRADRGGRAGQKPPFVLLCRHPCAFRGPGARSVETDPLKSVHNASRRRARRCVWEASALSAERRSD